MKVKRSNYFIPFKKESEAQGTIGRMLRGAFINQHASGIYIWLPLGLLMLEKIIKIIESEHEKIGAQKLLMPILQKSELWQQSQRYEAYGPEMLKITDRHKREFIYGPSAEEMFTQLLTTWPLKKDSFPLILYNIQWKFRDEIRPRFGTIRSREFLMKDAYSFDKSLEESIKTYELIFNVYSNIFAKLGLNICTFASDVGPMGGDFTHEFVIKSEFGETEIEFEKWPDQPLEWKEKDNAKQLDNSKIDNSKENEKEKYAEIGQIYALGTRYTKLFKLLNPENQQPLFMGSYGIGVSRLAPIMFENNEHDLGCVAPFEKTLITININDNEIAHKMFEVCSDIIWDDRDVSYGIKCVEADLIGSPVQIHIGQKELDNRMVTIKKQGIKETCSLETFFNSINLKS